MDICGRMSLLPGSCVCPSHPAVIGVLPALPATEKASMTVGSAALVTGSSKGLGAAISRMLAQRGYLVYITDHHDHSAAEEMVMNIRSANGHAEILPLGVTSDRSV